MKRQAQAAFLGVVWSVAGVLILVSFGLFMALKGLLLVLRGLLTVVRSPITAVAYAVELARRYARGESLDAIFAEIPERREQRSAEEKAEEEEDDYRWSTSRRYRRRLPRSLERR